MKIPALTEARLLVEQIRLMQTNSFGSRLGTSIYSLFLVWAFYDPRSGSTLFYWCALVMLGNLYSWRRAKRILNADPLEQIPQSKTIALGLIVYYLLYGCLWGVLPWIAQYQETTIGTMLIITYLAGMAGGGVALMSPVLPVYYAFATTLIGSIAVKMFSMGPDFYPICAATLFYLLLLSIQAGNSFRAAKTAIELRFENSELMDKLLIETEKAQSARREAEFANHAKSKFLAAASHDLRQPIHALNLLLGVLGREALNHRQQDILSSARASAEASADMLNTLLDFSRIEAGVVQPQLQAFSLQTLINKLETELAPLADAKNIVYRSRDTGLITNSDPALVELILRNLISNAIRYTEQGGVLIACRKQGGKAILEVWDTGIGIEPEQQREVFREFHQLGNPERDRQKGLGLGLAIADGLAKTLSSDLTLASKPGVGSVFKLTLPISASNPISAPDIAKIGPSSLFGLDVLVIEDDEAVRTSMHHLFAAWGCHCRSSELVEDALTMAGQRKPDLVVSDFRLREQRSGLEAIKVLRSELGEGLPALLITGDTAPDRLREARDSGVILLNKPLSPEQLYSGLITALRKT